MSSNRRRRAKSGPFVMLPHILLNSDAWRSLLPISRAAYIELAKGYNGKNNGLIVMSARQMGGALNVSKYTAARALRDLRDRGFVKLGFVGSFKTKHERLASTYLLTLCRDDRNGNLPTKDFLHWIPPLPTQSEPKPKRLAGTRRCTVYAAKI